MEGLQLKYIKQDPAYDYVFEGAQYPQAKEADKVIQLCQFILDTYICFDPLDGSYNGF